LFFQGLVSSNPTSYTNQLGLTENVSSYLEDYAKKYNLVDVLALLFRQDERKAGKCTLVLGYKPTPYGKFLCKQDVPSYSKICKIVDSGADAIDSALNFSVLKEYKQFLDATITYVNSQLPSGKFNGIKGGPSIIPDYKEDRSDLDKAYEATKDRNFLYESISQHDSYTQNKPYYANLFSFIVHFLLINLDKVYRIPIYWDNKRDSYEMIPLQIGSYIAEMIKSVTDSCSNHRVYIPFGVRFFILKDGYYDSNTDNGGGHAVSFMIDTTEKEIFMFDSNGTEPGSVTELFHKRFVQDTQGKLGLYKDWKWIDIPCPNVNIGVVGLSPDGMCTWFAQLFQCLALDNPNVPIKVILDYMSNRNKQSDPEFILNFMFRYIYLLDSENIEPFVRARQAISKLQ